MPKQRLELLDDRRHDGTQYDQNILKQLLARVVSLSQADGPDPQASANKIAANKVLDSIVHGMEESSQELQDEEVLSDVVDWATDSLARTAAMAQETVEHRRALLREMAVRERKIDQKLAKTARSLDRLIVD